MRIDKLDVREAGSISHRYVAAAGSFTGYMTHNYMKDTNMNLFISINQSINIKVHHTVRR